MPLAKRLAVDFYFGPLHDMPASRLAAIEPMACPRAPAAPCSAVADRFGSSECAFRTPGAVGSFEFADTDEHLGWAHAANKPDSRFGLDRRGEAPRDAIHGAVRAAAICSA
mgnify:CR=1 FL=1